PGFDPTNVLTVGISLPRAKYDEQKRIDFFQQLLARVRPLPGVQSAALGSAPPFTGVPAGTGFTIEGRPPVPPPEQPVTDVRIIDQNYFGTMGITLQRGRNFDEREVQKRSHVVIINETLARTHFPNEDPLGKRLTIEMRDENEPTEIIGIVGDVRSTGLDVPSREMVYWPHAELPGFPVMLVVKTNTEVAAMTGAIQREVL